MLRLKCNCGKTLAAGETRCNLCALGLAPARQVDVAANYQTGVQVSSREPSGISCPRCMARLSVAEVAHSTCSHCHATVARDVIPTVAHNRSTRFALKNSNERRAAAQLWPESAPTK
jgi:protein-arginine kinase activator protein McsA